MEGSSSSSEIGVRKGAWSGEEDLLLKKCIAKYGEGKWGQVPLRAGLNRCRKSCRLRWLNYLRPNINRGEFQPDEVDFIIRMHKLLGNRWSLIAGRLQGRTANDIKNYYNTHLKKSCITQKGQQLAVTKESNTHPDGQDHDHPRIIKRRRPCPNISTVHHNDADKKRMITKVSRPQPRAFGKSQWNMNNVPTPPPTGMDNDTISATARYPNNSQVVDKNITTKHLPLSNDQQMRDNSIHFHWLKNILFGDREEEQDLKKKKKKKSPKQKKGITSDNINASIEIEATPTFGVGESDHNWNNYLDDNLWGILGEEQDQYLMI